MSSLAPSTQCCSKIASIHEGETKGLILSIYGQSQVYVTGAKQSDKVVVIVSDIFGLSLKNNLLIADAFAEEGYYVLIPDLFNGDVYKHGEDDLIQWVMVHAAKSGPIFELFLKELHDDLKPKFVGLVGHCYGAKFAIRHLTETGLATVGALAHPSMVTIEEVAAIKKPVVISAAEKDPVFTKELRRETEDKLLEIDADFQITLFAAKGKIKHGYAVRGDISDLDIKYAKEKTFKDQVDFFDRYA